MGDRRPITPDLNGDESVLEPRFSNPSLLGAQRGTDEARRLETDASNNLFCQRGGGFAHAERHSGREHCQHDHVAGQRPSHGHATSRYVRSRHDPYAGPGHR